MADGWKDVRQRHLINFMVSCYKGTIFLKSVDATDIVKTGQALFELFREVVEEVGPENVIQFITDNPTNYALAGKKLQDEYPTIFWSSCAAHCIDLMLEEIGKESGIALVVNKAQDITKFIYNHSFLNLMRKHTDKRELIRPAITRFATNFLSIQSMLRQQVNLKSMVTSTAWRASVWASKPSGKEMVEGILDTKFWNSMALIFQITEPLVKVLRIVDGEKAPAIGYIYEAMDRAKEGIAKAFNNKKNKYDPYWKIIDRRWDAQLHRPIHAAAYYLNPKFFYDQDKFSGHCEIRKGLYSLIEMHFPGEREQVLVGKQMTLYENGTGEFGRPYAKNTRSELLPAEWWNMFGGETPELRKFVVRILSQTCSSSGCERNWSVFARVHTDARNRLEHKRLNDLVFVQYNLNLKERTMRKPPSCDPIDLDTIDIVKEWVVEAEQPILDGMDDELDNWMEMDPLVGNQDDDGVIEGVIELGGGGNLDGGEANDGEDEDY